MSSTASRNQRRHRAKAFAAFKALTPEEQAAELARVQRRVGALQEKVQRVQGPPDVHPMCLTADDIRWQVKASKLGAALPAWAHATRKALAAFVPEKAADIAAIETGTIAWIDGCPFEVVDEPASGEPEALPS